MKKKHQPRNPCAIVEVNTEDRHLGGSKDRPIINAVLVLLVEYIFYYSLEVVVWILEQLPDIEDNIVLLPLNQPQSKYNRKRSHMHVTHIDWGISVITKKSENTRVVRLIVAESPVMFNNTKKEENMQ